MDFTRVPNYFFDHMADMDKCELGVVLFIVRKTLGYQKEWDKISLSQFMESTNMNKPSIHKGLQSALNRGIIERRQSKNSFEYRILEPRNGTEGEPIYETGISEAVQKMNQNGSKNEPIIGAESEPIITNGSKNEPKTVQKMNTQKKKEINIPSNEGSAKRSTPLVPSGVNGNHETTEEEKAIKERRAALKAAYVEVIGHENINHAQVGQGIKLLERAGCAPEQLKGCYRWLKLDPFWEFKPIAPQTIFKNLSEYMRYEQRLGNTFPANAPKPAGPIVVQADAGAAALLAQLWQPGGQDGQAAKCH